MNASQRILSTTLAGALATGCGGTAKAPATAPSVVQALTGNLQGRIYPTNGCLYKERPATAYSKPESSLLGGALLAAIVPAVLDKGFDLLASAFERAAKDEAATVSATLGGYYYRYRTQREKSDGNAYRHVDPELTFDSECLGYFVLEPGRDRKAFTIALERAGFATASDYAEAGLKGIEGLGPVAFVEWRLLPSLQRDAVMVRPEIVWIGENLGGTPSKETVNLVLTQTMKALDGTTIATEAVELPKLTVGTVLKPADLVARQGAWLPVAETSARTKEEIAKWAADYAPIDKLRKEEDKTKKAGKTIEPAKKAKIDGYKGFDASLEPYNLTLSITQMRKGKAWAGVVAEVLKGSKEGVVGALTTELVPEKRAAADTAAQKSKATLEKGLAEALGKQSLACLEYDIASKGKDEAATRIKKNAVVSAQYDANVAAIELGKALPFPSPDEVSCSAP